MNKKKLLNQPVQFFESPKNSIWYPFEQIEESNDCVNDEKSEELFNKLLEDLEDAFEHSLVKIDK